MEPWTIGVDIGGTKVAVALVTPQGKVEHSIQSPTNASRGYKSVLKIIFDAINSLIKPMECPPESIGVGIAGQVDPNTGFVYYAPNLGWTNVPLQKDLSDVFRGIPVKVMNDVRAATWAEWHYGAGRNMTDFAAVFVGTGIGGSIVSQGRLIEGYSNTAGEIGHTIVSLNGPQCGCGQYGCLEAIAGGLAIGKRAQEYVQQNPESGALLLKLSGGKFAKLTAKVVEEAYLQGDSIALKVIEEAIEALTAGLVNIVNLLNPQRIILGGGVIDGLPELVQKLESGVKHKAVRASVQGLEIVQSQLGSYAVVIGAALKHDTQRKDKGRKGHKGHKGL